MPPPRFNPIERSRRQFLELEDERRFFPRPNGNSFSPAVESGLAASSRLAMDELADERDNRETLRTKNQLGRLEAAGRMRVLPHSTNAEIAAQQLREKQARLDEANSPFLADSERENAQTNIQQQQANRRMLPVKEQAQTQEFERAISGEDRLKADEIDPLAYDFSLRSLDKALPQRERQRQARNAALRMRHDQPYVEAIEQEAIESGDPAIRDKYLEDLIDEETGARFTRVKRGVPPGEVNTLLRKRAYTKEQAARAKAEQAMAREERIANAAFDNNRLMALKEAKATAMLTAKDDAADPELRAAARRELSELDAAIKEIALRPTARPERVKADEEKPEPTPSPAAEEKKPTKSSYLEEARKAALGE